MIKHLPPLPLSPISRLTFLPSFNFCFSLSLPLCHDQAREYYSSVDFTVSVYVDDTIDNDYFGIIWGYQSPSKFYLLSWKKKFEYFFTSRPFAAIANPGIQIKVE